MLLTRRIRFDPVRSDLIQYAPVWSGIIRIVPASHNKSLQYSPNKQECTGYIRVSLGAQFQQFQHFCVIWLWKPAPGQPWLVSSRLLASPGWWAPGSWFSPGWWAPGSWPALAGELRVPGSALAGELEAPGQPWLVSSRFLVQPWLVSSRFLVRPGWWAPGSWSALASELQVLEGHVDGVVLLLHHEVSPAGGGPDDDHTLPLQQQGVTRRLVWK